MGWTSIPFDNLDFNNSEWQEFKVENLKHRDQPPIKFYISKKNENVVTLIDINKRNWKLAFKFNAKFHLLNNIFSYDTDTVEQ